MCNTDAGPPHRGIFFPPKNHGNEINIEQELPQTKIFALKGIADHYEDSSRLSSYHDYEILPEPCQGKPGGVETL